MWFIMVLVFALGLSNETEVNKFAIILYFFGCRISNELIFVYRAYFISKICNCKLIIFHSKKLTCAPFAISTTKKVLSVLNYQQSENG